MILVQVTIYDDDSGAVKEQTIGQSSSNYGWEVEKMFYQLGIQTAKKVHPSYCDDE